MIVCCGEALVDVLPGDRVVPGGGPMNAAVAAARLGPPTAFVGRVSTDADGNRIWAHLQASDVILDAAQRGGEPTARAVVELKPGPVFRFEGEGTADASMTTADLSPLGPGPHLLHGGTLGIFRGSTAGVLADLVEGHPGLVSFDPNVRPQIITDRAAWQGYAHRWLARADVVKASDEDLEWMEVTAEELVAQDGTGGPAVVLRTLGAEGVEAFLAGGGYLRVASPVVEMVDAVGAGDAFCGAVLCQLWERGIVGRPALDALGSDEWASILAFATRVASITVGRPGADPPRRSEV